MTSVGAAAPSSDFDAELIAYLRSQRLRAVASVTVIALLVGSLAWGKAPSALVAGWIVAAPLAQALRGYGVPWLLTKWRVPPAEQLRWLALGSFVNGLAHGAMVSLWPHLDAAGRLALTMFGLGMPAAAMVTVMGDLRLYLPYTFTMLALLAVRWVLALSGEPDGAAEALVVAVALALYAALLAMTARDTARLYRESFDNRRRLAETLHVAEAANQSKTRFLASASHDLRQPMHTLTLFSAALAMRPLDEVSRRLAAAIDESVQVLGAQLDTLLDISRLDAGVVSNVPADVMLAPLFRRLQAQFAPSAHAKRLTLAVDATPLLGVHADATLVERVLRNLLDNAVKYTERGTVRLCARLESREPHTGDVVIEVQDTGIGIAEHDRLRVFEEFFQVDNPERDRRRGLGLGLSIASRLCRLMDAPLTLDSTPGVGTTFTLRLPAMRSIASGGREPAGLPSIAGLRALVIDDEQNVREGMRALLESLGCTVALAADGDEAEAKLLAGPVDIVLADFRLRADESGVVVIQRLRARAPGLPALLISGDTAPQRLREAEHAGLRLLHKPVALAVLLRAIASALRERETTSEREPSPPPH